MSTSMSGPPTGSSLLKTGSAFPKNKQFRKVVKISSGGMGTAKNAVPRSPESTIRRVVTPKATTSTPIKKKRKRASPFRIKLGCIVALRYRSEGNNVKVLLPAPSGKDDETKVKQMRLPTDVAEVWADPQPGRDDNLALIGQRIRCGFPKSVLSIPNTTTRIVEGEIVGIIPDDVEAPLENLRTKAIRPTVVELLVDRTMLQSMPFLERIDKDIEVKALSDVEKKRHRYEQTIRGKNKVVLKVQLAPISNVAAASHDDTQKDEDDTNVIAKWAIRKRIPLSNDVGVAEERKTMSVKPPSSSQQNLHVGNKFDSDSQQERNWRWIAARHLELGFPNVGTVSSLEDVQTFPGFVGEVVGVVPVVGEKTTMTLADVTLRRLFLPEHTRHGRLPHHGRNELFDDADGGGNVRYVVPVEELIILQRKCIRLTTTANGLTNKQHQGTNNTAAVISHSYSLRNAIWLQLPSSGGPSNGSGYGTTNGEKTMKVTMKATPENKAPCHRCKTNPVGEGKTLLCDECVKRLRPFRKLQGTKQMDACDCMECRTKLGERIHSSFLLAVERSFALTGNNGSATPFTKENDVCMVCCRACKTGVRCAQCNGAMHKHCYLWNKTLTVGNAVVSGKQKLCRTCAATDEDGFEDRTVVSNLQRLVPSDFDLPIGFMATDSLPRPSPRVITAIKPRSQKAKSTSSLSGKKRGRHLKVPASKANDAAESVHDKKAKMDTQQPPPLAEEFSVFEPTCSRALPYNHAQGRVQGVKKHRMASDVTIIPDLRRNHRPAEDDGSTNTPNKSSMGRAARANQRRVKKGVAALRQYQADSDLGASSRNAFRDYSPTKSSFSTSFLELDAIAGRESNVLRFDRSDIHAWGVFADQPIAAGEMIVEYRGEIIGNAMAEKRQIEYERARGSDYMFRIDAHTVCDATKLGNVARFLNASCEPNCHTQIITIQGTKRIAIYAKKDIRVGDELCYDYKFSLEYDEEKRIPCRCGAKDCRGYMNWDKKYDGRKAR